MQERIVMCEGFVIKIRKVVTGGYAPEGAGKKRTPKLTYYALTYKGERVDNTLTLSRALRAARRAGLRLLREEIEHDTNLARQGLR